MSDEDRTAEFKQIGDSKIPEQRIAEVSYVLYDYMII